MDEKRKMQKRYGKFDKCNLPVPFWDEKRETLEYVFYDPDIRSFHKPFMSDDDTFDRRLQVEKNLSESLSNICGVGFYYPFESNYFTFANSKSGEIGRVITLGDDHAHSFEEVVKSLYDFPETFNIKEEDKKFYSEQELRFLRRIKNYLLFIGLKDLTSTEYPSTDLSRYENDRQKKYFDAHIRTFPETTIAKFKKRERDFIVREWYEEHGLDEKTYDGDFKILVVDEEDNFKLFLDVKKEKVVPYKEFKDSCPIEDKLDEELFIIQYFEILEEY